MSGLEGGGLTGGGVGGSYQPGVYVPLKALFLVFHFLFSFTSLSRLIQLIRDRPIGGVQNHTALR